MQILLIYIYNAAGEKLRKTVNDTQNNTIKVVEYLDGFQYAGGVLQFFSHAEGYVAATQGTKTDQNGNLSYIFNYVNNYTDHLGNIRLSYTKDPVSGELEIMEENHYYPFGLKHDVYAPPQQKYELDEEEENLARPAYVYETEYQYKYNGKEFQDELNLSFYDFGARNYDPALGRWMNIDPLAEKNPGWTPYRYAFNNPNIFTDPTGMLEDWYQSGEGDYVYDASITSEQDFIDAGLDGKYLGESASFGVTSSGEQIGTVNLNTDGSADFVTTGGEISSFTDATVDMGFDSGHLIKAGNWQEGNNMNWDDVVQNLNGFGFANGTKTGLIDIAGRNGGLTKTTQNYLKFYKGVGYLAGGINVGYAGYKFYENPTAGNATRLAVQGIAMGTAFIPGVGWMISAGIGAADMMWGDQLYEWIDNN